MLQLICSKRDNEPRLIKGSKGMYKSGQPCHYIVAEQVLVKVGYLTDDAVVDEPAFDGGNDAADVHLLLHEPQTVGKRYGADDIESIELLLSVTIQRVNRRCRRTCTHLPRSKSRPSRALSF